MRSIFTILVLCFSTFYSKAETRTIHVFVALCDNVYQGIVPVPDRIGNGKDPDNNLYWGCGYGVRSFFKLKTKDWVFIEKLPSNNPKILERVVFKHAAEDVYMIADAYDGEHIQTCITEFLLASNGQNSETVEVKGKKILCGGASELIAYIGHDGLMEFSVSNTYLKTHEKKDVIILACYSQDFFKEEILSSGANPILWTTHLMAPEAYTLKAAIDGWMKEETGAQIEERAAQTYNTYQKCGIRGARNLFTHGF